MLVRHESAHILDGVVRYRDGTYWFQLSTRPKPNFDVMRELTQRVRYVRLDGTSVFMDATKINDDNISYYLSNLVKQFPSVLEGELSLVVNA